MNSLDKFIMRQNARHKMIFGINKQVQPLSFGLGVSEAGVYIHIQGNVETCKRLHRETLECLRLMPNPKLKGI